MKTIARTEVGEKQRALFTDKIIDFLSGGNATMSELQSAVVNQPVVEAWYDG